MTPADSARKEAFEEAGVKGTIASVNIGTYDYSKADSPEHPRYRVEVFPLVVTEISRDWPERFERKREWMSLDKAIASVHEPDLKTLLKVFWYAIDGGKEWSAGVATNGRRGGQPAIRKPRLLGNDLIMSQA